jgi:hypothetical protein
MCEGFDSYEPGNEENRDMFAGISAACYGCRLKSLQAEVERLSGLPDGACYAEWQGLKAEVVRLKADKALYIEEFTRVTATRKAAEAEAERLRGDYETSHASRVHADSCVLRLEAEAEVERLRLDYDHLDAYLMERTGSMIGWKLRSEAAEAEVERLRAALREISLLEDDPLRASKTRAIIARVVLAPEVK